MMNMFKEPVKTKREPLVAHLDAYRWEPTFQDLANPLEGLRNCKLCTGFNSKEIHRRKHAIRAYKEVKKGAFDRLEWITELLKIQEFFLNERSKISLWYVGSHVDYHHAISDVTRYWNRYAKLTFQFAVDLYRTLDAIFQLKHIKKEFETVTLRDLKDWINCLEKFDATLSIMNTIDKSHMAKASKESYLRDIRSGLLRNWHLYDILATEVIGEYVGSDPNTGQSKWVRIPKFHLKLDFVEVITSLFKNLDEFIAEDAKDELNIIRGLDLLEDVGA